MKNYKIVQNLIKIANELDNHGYFNEANKLTKIAQMFPEDFPEFDPDEIKYDLEPKSKFRSDLPVVIIISLNSMREMGVGQSTEDMLDIPGVIDERGPGGMFDKMNKKYNFVYSEEEMFEMPDGTTGPLKEGMTVRLGKVKHPLGWAVLEVLKTGEENEYENFSSKKYSSKKKINLTPKLQEFKNLLSYIDNHKNIKTADRFSDRAEEIINKIKIESKREKPIDITNPVSEEELVEQHNLDRIGMYSSTKRYFYFKRQADKHNIPLLNFVQAFFPNYYDEIARMENSINPPVPIPEPTDQELWEAGKREDEQEFERTRQSIEWELKLDKFAEEKSQELNMSKEDFIKVYLPRYNEWLELRERKIRENLQDLTPETVERRMEEIPDEYAEEQASKISNFDFNQLVENAGMAFEALGEAIEPLSKRFGEVFQGVIYQLNQPKPILEKSGKVLKVLLSFFDPNSLQQAMDEMQNELDAREAAIRELDDFVLNKYSFNFMSSNFIKYNFSGN